VKILVEYPLKNLLEKYLNNYGILEIKIKLLLQLVENLEKQNNYLKKYSVKIFLLGLSIGVFLMSIIITLNRG
jgi:hypothetical protein